LWNQNYTTGSFATLTLNNNDHSKADSVLKSTLTISQLFEWNRSYISLLGFINAELPGLKPLSIGENKCPLPKHQENEGQSFYIDERRGRCYCRGRCNITGADISQIGAIIWNCTNTEAAKRIYNDRAKYPRRKTWARVGRKKRSHYTWNWGAHLTKLTKSEMSDLAWQRQIPKSGIQRASSLGLLWRLPANFNSEKSRRQGDAWVITDSTLKQAMRRRMDGDNWYGGAKSKLLPGCSGKTEIGLKEALSHKRIVVVEGGPDLLAALGYFPGRGVICMPSAYTDFSSQARRALIKPRYTISIIPHNDEAGTKALERWTQQLRKAQIEWMELPEGIKDFNDWLSLRR
jgi:hypothetical protein